MGKNEKQRGYFPFFRSIQDAISDLDDVSQLEMYRAVVRYGLDGIEPELTGFASTLWKVIFPNLRNSRKQFENGLKGGAPKGSANARKWKKPTLEEIESYCEEKGYQMDAARFFDYNEAIGWAKAKSFKDWKEAADLWEQKINSGEYED